eukprot:6408463-Ditylum_brightwellii.AAC.1
MGYYTIRSQTVEVCNCHIITAPPVIDKASSDIIIVTVPPHQTVEACNFHMITTPPVIIIATVPSVGQAS